LKRTVEINDEMYKLTLADFQAGNTLSWQCLA